jgi:UDP-glucose 4-epimerase
LVIKKDNELKTKHILIVGGAGYIGSHMTLHLQRSGYTPIVLDDLSTGHREAVLEAKLIVGSVADSMLLDEVFSSYQFDAVMHFASFIQVGESVLDPLKYYQNNVANTLTLLSAMLKHGVTKFIFSSTAAVYGEPQAMSPINESHPLKPINPYGWTKRLVEQILEDYARAYDFKYAALRYFNAAGADPSGRIRECHEPGSHLIPLIFQVAKGQRKAIIFNGRDYPTPDGTCVRDYVHVNDLCSAHLLALEALTRRGSCIYNLGTGQGYSVLQVTDVVRKVTGCDIAVIDGPRRNGDPAMLVADPTRAMKELHWQPRYLDLTTIIEHAWG